MFRLACHGGGGFRGLMDLFSTFEKVESFSEEMIIMEYWIVVWLVCWKGEDEEDKPFEVRRR